MFCPDTTRHIASFISSPSDLYSFSLLNKEIRGFLSNAYSKKLRRSLCQAYVFFQLKESEGRSRVLLGETGTGKTHLILHYILDYWRRTGNSIIVVLHGYKVHRWKKRAKSLFGDEIPLFTGLKETKGLSMIASCDHDSNELIDSVINYTYSYDNISTIPSSYRMMITDDENIIQRKPHPIETIYVERPSLYLKKRRKEIRQLPRIHLSHPYRFSVTPSYHKEVLIASPSDLEDFILKSLVKHDKIVVLGSTDYEGPAFSYDKLKKENIYLREDKNAFPTPEEINTFNRSKKAVFYGLTFDLISHSVHADCIIFYSIFADDYMNSSEAERTLLSESNPNKTVTIYCVREKTDNEVLHRTMLASRILRHHLGDTIEQRFNKIFRNWSKWKDNLSLRKMDLCGIDSSSLNTIYFVVYYRSRANFLDKDRNFLC